MGGRGEGGRDRFNSTNRDDASETGVSILTLLLPCSRIRLTRIVPYFLNEYFVIVFRNVGEIIQPRCIQIRSNFLWEICHIIALNQTLSLSSVNLARWQKSASIVRASHSLKLCHQVNAFQILGLLFLKPTQPCKPVLIRHLFIYQMGTG